MKKLQAVFLGIVLASVMSISTAFAAESPIIDYFGGSSFDYFRGVSLTKDGGCVAVGESWSYDGDMKGFSKGSDDAVLVKYDANGNVEWIKTFGGSFFDTFYDVKQTRDGGYIAVGCSNSLDGDMAGSAKAVREGNTEVPNHDAIIVKFDSKGNMEWFSDFGGSNLDKYNSVIETKDGNYLAVGETKSWDGSMTGLLKGEGDCLIAMYDSNGNLMWLDSFGSRGIEGLSSVVECQDGSFVAVGYTNSTDGYMDGTGSALLKGLMVRFDSNQNIIWVKALELMNPDIRTIVYASVYGFTDVAVTSDNGIIVSGAGIYLKEEERIYKVCSDGRLFKFDNNGNIEWGKIYKYADYTNLLSVIGTKDGSYISVGYSYSEMPVNSIVVSYDSKGQLKWAKSDGGSSNGDFRYIESKDDKYIIVGSTHTKDKSTEALLYIGNFEEYDGKLILSPETTKIVAPNDPSYREALSDL